MYRIEHACHGLVIAPHFSPGHEIFYVSTQQAIKVYMARNVLVVGDKNTLASPTVEYRDHSKGVPKMIVSTSGEWLLTYGVDGFITVRSLIEPEKFSKVFSHDSAQGGTLHAAFSRDCRYIITIGFDGTMKRFHWKYTSAGKRSAIEATNAAETYAADNMEIAEKIVKLIRDKGSVVDTDDKIDVPKYITLPDQGKSWNESKESHDV